MLALLSVFRRGYRSWGYPGLYIVAMASVLHFCWASLLCFDSNTLETIPVYILYALLRSKVAVIFVLLLVSTMAGLFSQIAYKRRHKWWTALLIPQQVILWFSAGAGVYAAFSLGLPHHAVLGAPSPPPSPLLFGGSPSWARILASEMPMIVLALLYGVALIEIQRPPPGVQIVPPPPPDHTTVTTTTTTTR